MSSNYRNHVEVYNEVFLVDTKTGEGIDLVLKKIDPLLCKLAAKYFIQGYSFEDLKQEFTVMAIEGIHSYNYKKSTKLSTFLQHHLRNKIFSKIKSENKMAKDAFSFQIEEDSSEKAESFTRARDEIHFSQFNYMLNKNGEGGSISFENNISEDENIFQFLKKDYSTIEFEASFQKLLPKLDRDTAKVLELVYYKDYSLNDAARIVGLTPWAISEKLKRLAEKKYVKDIFNKA